MFKDKSYGSFVFMLTIVCPALIIGASLMDAGGLLPRAMVKGILAIDQQGQRQKKSD